MSNLRDPRNFLKDMIDKGVVDPELNLRHSLFGDITVDFTGRVLHSADKKLMKLYCSQMVSNGISDIALDMFFTRTLYLFRMDICKMIDGTTECPKCLGTGRIDDGVGYYHICHSCNNGTVATLKPDAG
jgi:hypothetical protein